jgi:hypothetical protein
LLWCSGVILQSYAAAGRTRGGVEGFDDEGWLHANGLRLIVMAIAGVGGSCFCSAWQMVNVAVFLMVQSVICSASFQVLVEICCVF